MRERLNRLACGALASLALGASAHAASVYDANVTSNAIFGSGNINGSFTVDRANGVELGLRGKLRHNASGAPENTFNSNGDGTYSFDAGVAPTQSAPTAVWSVEWSINSDFDGTSGFFLDDLTYALSFDTDPGMGTSFSASDPINLAFADHSIGTNATLEGQGIEAVDAADYASLIAQNNLAQNSWKAHWVIPGFDPTLDGVYDVELTAFDGSATVASTNIQIIVGAGVTAVPSPAAVGVGVPGLLALVLRRRRKQAD